MRSGTKPSFAFAARDHLDLAQPHGWLDAPRGTKVSGSRFIYRLGDLALLEMALYRYALARVTEKGHIPMLPPVLVREEAMYGTGFFPTERSTFTESSGTSSISWARPRCRSRHFMRGEFLEELPLRYVAYSTCFRREAGAAGKDTRGMFRVHQFDKVEMFVYCVPEASADEHERLLAIEEGLVKELDLPYRVINVAAGDLGAPAVKKYDIEAWFPGQGRYREITSTSNTTDFQVTSTRDPLSSRWEARARTHAQWHGDHCARDDRDPGEFSGGRRIDCCPERAVGVRRSAQDGVG